MTDIFALLVETCGLSPAEVAGLFNVDLIIAEAWLAGHAKAPSTKCEVLVQLSQCIEQSADNRVATIKRAARASNKGRQLVLGELELELAHTDAEARASGWPCVGAMRASVALTVTRGMAEGYSFVVVGVAAERP